jgi:hypothetical protein
MIALKDQNMQQEVSCNNVNFFHGSTALVGLGLLCGFPRSHSDTPHSVGSLWTSDQPTRIGNNNNNICELITRAFCKSPINYISLFRCLGAVLEGAEDHKSKL